jgi:Asp-tRNA(Asn)/Glu-tRNA(Gln) amidotransferase A subunit family amidase
MKVFDITAFDGLGLAELVRNREVSAIEVLDATLDRISTIDPAINSVWTVFESRARQAIANGLPDGPFTGVPFPLKDLGIKLEGTVTSNGSKFFESDTASFSSELAKRYENAGLVIVAKVATSEFGLGPTADTDIRPRTNNPWDTSKIAGGSSTGSAASVAARLFPMSHASDGGGSIRIPAACCGVFGFKPSRGLVSFAPVAEAWSGMSVQHAITRSVRDSAALLDCSAGSVSGDPYYCPLPETSFAKSVQTDPPRLRIAVHLNSLDGIVPDPEIAASVMQMAKLLESLGHEIILDTPTFDISEVAKLYSIITSASVQMLIENRSNVLGREPKPEELLSVSRQIALRGKTHRAVDLALAREACFAASRKISQFTEQYDAVLCPTIAHLPPAHGTYDMRNPDLDDYFAGIFKFAPYTSLASLAGQPAMSIPFGMSTSNLPIGVHFSSKIRNDQLLFSLAGQLEKAYDWNRTPQLGLR